MGLNSLQSQRQKISPCPEPEEEVSLVPPEVSFQSEAGQHLLNPDSCWGHKSLGSVRNQSRADPFSPGFYTYLLGNTYKYNIKGQNLCNFFLKYALYFLGKYALRNVCVFYEMKSLLFIYFFYY